MFIPSITGAGQRPFNLYDGVRYRHTHPIPVQCWTSVAAHCWFNAGPSSTTLAQHWSNTGSAVYFAPAHQQTHGIHLMLLQCWPTVFHADQHWNSFGWISVFAGTEALLYAGDTSCQKIHFPVSSIHSPNADVMLGHRLWRWASIIPNKTL